MTNQKRNLAPLHRLIRQIVREELSRFNEEKSPTTDEPDPNESWEPPPDREHPAPPPWAVFGAPRPAPERSPHDSPPSRKPFGPYQPQHDIAPPPFISHRREYR